MAEATARKGWTRVSFGDVVRQVKDKVDSETAGLDRYIAGEHMDTDDLRLRRWGEIGSGYLGPAFHMRFKPGQVLYGSRRTYLRKVALADFEGITANTTYVLESADAEVLLPELLPFIMQAEDFHDHSKRESKGSVNPYVNFSDLAWYEFVLPSLDEQRRIARIFTGTELARSSLDSVWAKGILLRDSLLGWSLMGEGSSRDITRGRDRDRWPFARLGDRYEVKLGKMMSPSARQGSNQVPYMKNANVQWGELDLSEIDTMHIPEDELEAYTLRYGDILACEGRHVGKSAIWRDEVPGACYQKALHRLRPLDPALDRPEFLLLCLRYYSVSGRLVREIGETTIPHLPAERLREIRFPFPSLEDQTEICDRIGALDLFLERARSRTEAIRDVSRTLLAGMRSAL